MPFIDRDELRLAFDDTGPLAEEAGPPIVLCHSFLCTREMWAAQADVLSGEYRVINLDLRGHGDSGPAEDECSVADLAYDVLAVLDHLEIEQAVWCGLSIGGMTSMRAAIAHPDRVAALVVADSSAAAEPFAKRAKYSVLANAARVFGTRRLMPAVLPIMFGRTTIAEQPELVEEWGERMASTHLPSLLNLLRLLMRREAMLDRLGEIQVPTLVLVGEEDKSQPPPRSREIAAGIPGAELVVVPRAGHLSALEQPEPVTTAIRSFLAGIGAADR